MSVEKVSNFLLEYQQYCCNLLTSLESKKEFLFDAWQKEGNLTGKGISAVVENGNVIEKGGVNYSNVSAQSLPKAASSKRPELAGSSFIATGVSIVLHPLNPYAPTSHANVRYFTTTDDKIWWFGGGFDLTPYFGFKEDCVFWHNKAKEVCDKYGDGVYQKYKQECDDYFYLPHRDEHRGIGGIFFDDLNSWGFDKCFSFLQDVAYCYIDTYKEILEKRYILEYTKRDRNFQLYRRGRYVEFNLLYDRGTLFGLQSKGRTKSILMSMPPKVTWNYDDSFEEEEKELLSYIIPQKWV